MPSMKIALCDLCHILLFGLIVAFPQDTHNKTITADEELKGNCSCGGFPVNNPEASKLPLLSQTPGLVVKCDEEGNSICKNLCTALATATKAKGPEILCNRLKNADELKLSAFYKICEGPWVYANMTAEEPLCCDNSKVIICPSVSKNNSTLVLDSKSPM